MDRIELIQTIILKYNFKTYLEIGCKTGNSFLPIVCKNKIAVDPIFKIGIKKKLKWLYLNPTNLRNEYFEETSDSFFENRQLFLQKKNPIDVVFIDGMHTFENSLKDVINSLKFINKKGWIVMHDCFPPNKAASTPSKNPELLSSENIPKWTGEWCGDVWKTIVYLRHFLMTFLKFLLLIVIMVLESINLKKDLPKKIKINLDYFNRINELTFEDLMENPEDKIGLTNSFMLEKIIHI